MSLPKISVIIVTYNSSAYITQCLASLFVSLKKIKSEIIIIDNASTDDTLATLKSYKKKVAVIAAKENQGFGKAVNVGYKRAKGEYVWLVNPDAFVAPDCAREMLSAFENDSMLGIVGAQMRYQDGALQGSFGYRPTFVRELMQMGLLYHYAPVGRVVLPTGNALSMFYTSHDVVWVSGGCMMIARVALGKSKTIFNPAFFMYMEDIDVCLRVAEQGYRVWYCATAQASHVHSASFGSGKGRFMFSNILEAQSVLQFWKIWHPARTIQYDVLRVLLKIKLAIKLSLLANTLSSEKQSAYWHKWNAL